MTMQYIHHYVLIQAQIFFYALTLTHVHFVDDICDYFSITRDIKELNSDERTMEEVINETEMLTLDEVFDKYIVKYLKEKNN